MESKPTNDFGYKLFHRGARWFAIFAGCYVLYLAALGPFLRVSGSRWFSSVPDEVVRVFWLPAMPIGHIPILAEMFEGYLGWWYKDPNTAG